MASKPEVYEYLFSESGIDDCFEVERDDIVWTADRLPCGRVLEASIDELLSQVTEELSLRAPTVLLNDIDVKLAEIMIVRESGRDVIGTAIEVRIPFSGNEHYFDITPSIATCEPPWGTVSNGHIEFTIKGEGLTAELVRQKIDTQLHTIQIYLENLANDFEEFNRGIPALILPLIKLRKAKVENDKAMIAALGFKVRY